MFLTERSGAGGRSVFLADRPAVGGLADDTAFCGNDLGGFGFRFLVDLCLGGE
jgi:hypothetical protein